MSLRRLWTPLVLMSIERDGKLIGRDVCTFIHLYYRPLMTISQLSQSTQSPMQTVRESVRRLQDAGWIYRHTEPGQTRGGLIVPWMPRKVEQQLVLELTQRRNSVQYFGEWLMRSALDYCVKDLRYIDESSPPWLLTPQGRRLRLDRHHDEANVAFEFQGSQHFVKGTDFVTTDEKLSRQFGNDGEKIRLCSLHQVELIEVLPRDLEYKRIRDLVAGSLELMPPRTDGPLYAELFGMCHQYAQKMSRG